MEPAGEDGSMNSLSSPQLDLSSPFEGWSRHSVHGAGATECASSGLETDVLMDPVLDFIGHMLMDEHMEECKCMEQEGVAYQAIANGFSEILSDNAHFYGEPSGSGEFEGDQAITNGFSEILSDNAHFYGEPSGSGEFEGDKEDYSWIDEVLVSDQAFERPLGIGDGKEASEEDASVAWHLEPSSHQNLQSHWRDDSPGYTNTEPDVRQGALLGSSLQGLPSTLPHRPIDRVLGSMSAGSLGSYLQAVPDSTRSVIYEDLPSRSTDLNFHGRPDTTLSHSVSDQLRRPPFGEDSRQLKSRSSPNIGYGDDGKPEETPGRPSSMEQPLSFVRNANLNAEKDAKILGNWSLDDAKECMERRKKHGNCSQSVSGGKKAASNNILPDAVDLRGLLVTCAQTLASNDVRKTNEILHEVRRHASPHGSGTQRVAHYFAEGLVARLAGTGPVLYRAMTAKGPSAARILRGYHLLATVCPFIKLSHFFANESILKVAEGATCIHVVDYGISYGLQWPCLISALAERKGGPPFLRITGIDFPHPGLDPAERVKETGERLIEYARTYKVPFAYQAIASKWEDVDEGALNLQRGEVVVINSIHRLRNVMDETVLSESPRRKVLSRMRSFNPGLVVIGVMNAGFNASFFVSRFREALYHFSSSFDLIETTVVDRENPVRYMMESQVLGKQILNAVACEGPERIERAETYRRWQARFQRVGFELLQLSSAILSKARTVVKSFYHKDFSVDDDLNWMVLGWKGRIVEGLSAWRPAP